MSPRRLAVVCGGASSEAAVSRDSGAQVLAALRAGGHDCTLLECDAELPARLRDGGYEAAFLAVHGRFGEDGAVQGTCELLGIPHTGSGVLASALCFDKATAKRLLVAAGIDTPAWRLVRRDLDTGATAVAMHAAAAELGMPLIVKPNRGGSTIGLTVVQDTAGLNSAWSAAAAHEHVLCERMVSGTEITIGILGADPPEALPTLEIVSHRPLYDYAAKYTAGQSEHIIPARLPEPQRVRAQQAATAAHAALGCEGMSRVDLIVDAAGVPWVLEVNTTPGLTALSLLPDAARAAGIPFESLCERILEDALQRHRPGCPTEVRG
ncbi:MAG TPA: D-alanine--D-alanine ligase [Candidatus Dormibacteraeota bacterium]|jgi:D-alanine-D-alanine ligase